MQVFPAATRPETPWKNGGGITRPVASAPGKAREFGWRLSPAELVAGGPAFAFPGDAPAYGAPLGGLVRDINLMLDPDCFTATLDYESNGVERPAGDAAHLVLALAPLTLNGVKLNELDAALLPAGEAISACGGALWIAALTART